MGFLDQKITNPRKGSREKMAKELKVVTPKKCWNSF
jgi:hypothetical protein